MNKVSVIMPCYNDGVYIKSAIKSVIKQTYKHIELIIIDDGSTDVYTINIINKIEKLNNKNIKVIHTKHLGPSGARNEGIKVANGKYILPLDADDIIEPLYIEKAVNILDKNDNIGIVYCKADLFDKVKEEWKLPEYSLENMLCDNVIFVTSLFYKRDWEIVGGFNENMKYGMEDYDFWLSLIELGREVYQIPEILFHYRIKTNSRTTEFFEQQDNVKETYKQIYKNHPTLYNKYRDIYVISLRNSWVDKIFENRNIIQSKNLKMYLNICKLFNKIPVLKNIVKGIISKI